MILPFEPEFFAGVGLTAQFVGHPLTEREWPSRAAARAALGIGPEETVLGIFPGSRDQEIGRLWPAFRGAAERLLVQGRCHRAVVAGTGSGRYPGAGRVEVSRGDPLLVFAAADAAMAKSGTTTLEAAIADLPMVVAYRVHALTGWLARRLVRVPWISLVNLVAGRCVVPELVQGEVTAERLAEALEPLLRRDDPRTVAQREGLAEVRRRLGGPGAAGRVAELAAGLLGR